MTIASKIDQCEDLMRGMLPAKPQALRVAILFRSIPGWGAGVGFYRMFVRAFALAAKAHGLEFGLLVDRHEKDVMAPLAGLPGDRWSIVRGKKSILWSETASLHGIEVFIDLFEHQPDAPGTGVITWIPDFQHVHMPQYFSADDLSYREQSFGERAAKAHFILCSSAAVAQDLAEHLPLHAEKAVVGRFPSNLVFESLPSANPAETLKKYHLPEKFALVANQFWKHKNHEVVLRAVAKAKNLGCAVPLVMTGLPLDYRDAANGPISQVLQLSATLDIHSLVHPLGQVPYADLIQIMRAATLIIQPSRFEGWSTIVQDAKALGRPVFCSDIPVHREQAPDASALFDCDDPGSLADLLVSRWSTLSAMWDLSAETAHLAKHLDVARDYGNAVATHVVKALAAASSQSYVQSIPQKPALSV
jgi:glycosyltransferase involved in cell wall biosynthesis